MKRLLDGDPPEGTKALLEALREREVDPFMETRVLGRVVSGKPRAVRWRLKPAGAFAVVAAVALVSVASAMAWRAAHRPKSPAPAPVVAPIAPAIVTPAIVTPAIVTPTIMAPTIMEPTIGAPAKKLAPKIRAHAPAAPPVVAAEPTPAPSSPAPALEESRLLLEAYRALRQEHDTDKARARVDEYLRRFPNGSLTEEALVIGLDASVDDPARAGVYAKRYLHDAPDGKHAARARAALQQP